MQPTTEFAILAPIPRVHFDSARDEGLTEVAFAASAKARKALDKADTANRFKLMKEPD